MFKDAIKKNIEAVKPMVTTYKTTYSDNLINRMFPILLINDEGWALTSKQAVENIIYADKVCNEYESIKKELIENKIALKKIFKKYKKDDNSILILKNLFLNAINSWTGLKLIVHEYLDMALIKFENPDSIMCKKYPIFANENASQGEILCSLSFPYDDINVFRYNHVTKDLNVIDFLNLNLQVLPLNGMLTRYIKDSENKVTLFEMNNNSYIGEIGAPIINTNGEIVGLSSMIAYKDTGIDINKKIRRDNNYKDVNQTNFMPFSLSINVDTIKEFLDKNKVKYNTK